MTADFHAVIFDREPHLRNGNDDDAKPLANPYDFSHGGADVANMLKDFKARDEGKQFIRKRHLSRGHSEESKAGRVADVSMKIPQAQFLDVDSKRLGK